MKTSYQNKKATEMKKDISQELNIFQITRSGFRNKGNILTIIDKEHIRTEPAQKLGNVEQANTKSERKIKHKDYDQHCA